MVPPHYVPKAVSADIQQMVQEQQQIRSQFKAPEGTYNLYSDKHSTCNFNAQRPVRLTFATLQHKGEPNHFLIYNQLDALAFANYDQTEKVSCTSFHETATQYSCATTGVHCIAVNRTRPVIGF